jgi:hypothetical protein
MTSRLLIFLTAVALGSGTAEAQDAMSVLRAASAAMGANNLKAIQYSGTGWNAIDCQWQ